MNSDYFFNDIFLKKIPFLSIKIDMQSEFDHIYYLFTIRTIDFKFTTLAIKEVFEVLGHPYQYI
jgi:hypothetical protein